MHTTQFGRMVGAINSQRL